MLMGSPTSTLPSTESPPQPGNLHLFQPSPQPNLVVSTPLPILVPNRAPSPCKQPGEPNPAPFAHSPIGIPPREDSSVAYTDSAFDPVEAASRPMSPLQAAPNALVGPSPRPCAKALLPEVASIESGALVFPGEWEEGTQHCSRDHLYLPPTPKPRLAALVCGKS